MTRAKARRRDPISSREAHDAWQTATALERAARVRDPRLEWRRDIWIPVVDAYEVSGDAWEELGEPAYALVARQQADAILTHIHRAVHPRLPTTWRRLAR